MAEQPTLFRGWWRPTPRPRQRRRAWQCVTEALPEGEAHAAALDYSARQGGGDIVLVPDGRIPSEERVR